MFIHFYFLYKEYQTINKAVINMIEISKNEAWLSESSKMIDGGKIANKEATGNRWCLFLLGLKNTKLRAEAETR